MRKRENARTRVPVSNRSAEPKRRLPKPSLGGGRLDIPSLAVIGVVVLLILATVYVPLKNYFDGRTEIARLEESIAAKQVEREGLVAEIERYEDEAFIEQEARRRLGVIEPGETAWRIVDGRMVPEGQMTTSSDDEEVQPEWYEVLWDSIAEEPPEEDGMQMPVE